MAIFRSNKIQEIKARKQKTELATILIVDDEEENLRALKMVLDESYHILIAKDGHSALELIKSIPDPQAIQVIICDQRMPKMKGVEFLKLTIPIIPETIRIVLTGFTDIEAIIGSINEGQIYKFLTKPIDSNELHVTLKRALEHYHAQEKNRLLLEECKQLNATLEKKVELRTAELQKAYQTIKDQKDYLNEELEDAYKTQQFLLPTRLPNIPNTKLAVKYTPMIQISGDFYNAFQFGETTYGLLIVDVTGHGPSAALFSFLIYGVFRDVIKSTTGPAEVLNQMNHLLDEKLPTEKFAAMFFGVYDSATRQLTYANAANPPGLIIRSASQEIITLVTQNPPIGIFSENFITFQENQIQLNSGDKLIFQTDAILEAANDTGSILGMKRILNFLKNRMEGSIEELLDELYQLAVDYSGKPSLDDDCTLLGLEVL